MSHISIMYIAAFLICKEINYIFDIQLYNFLLETQKKVLPLHP